MNVARNIRYKSKWKFYGLSWDGRGAIKSGGATRVKKFQYFDNFSNSIYFENQKSFDDIYRSGNLPSKNEGWSYTANLGI